MAANGKESVIEMEPMMDVMEKGTQNGLVHEATLHVLRGPLAPVNRFLDAIEENIREFCKAHYVIVSGLFYVILVAGYLLYLIAACRYDFEKARILLYLTIIILCGVLYGVVKRYFGTPIYNQVLHPLKENCIDRCRSCIKISAIVIFIIFVLFFLMHDTEANPSRLISVAGLFVYILIGFLFSTNRSRIRWRPVLWGFLLQFVFGLLILRTTVGYKVFKWLGDKVAIFLGFTSAGSKFLFFNLSEFAFTVLPIIVYFSAFTYVLWYLGVLQVVIKKISWVLQMTLGTSPAESFNAAGNIFIGQSEAPLLIRPFLEGMTESELHAVMTGGFATIAGSVLATYIHFGVSAHHLVSASFMSAPAALAMSKLMCPEVEEPVIKDVDDIKVEKSKEKNLFEAVAVGASMSISLVANIAVMLIAFLALLAFLNGLLGWLGSLVGVPTFSFEYICSYVFMPFAFIMGCSWDDSFKIAELLGVKTFLNEFIAYQRLGKLVNNKIDGTGETLTTRSEIIATYALCGFANFGSMGVQLGAISSLAPGKRGVLAKHVLRALVAGTLACFMTACIAGVLYEEENGTNLDHLNSTISTVTNALLATKS